MFIVLFEVHPAPGKRDEYLGYATDLKPVLARIDGFIDNERFESRSRAGWVLSASTWRDEKSVVRWRTEMRHHLTQVKGRGGILADYNLRVGEVTADTAPPIPILEHRFDVTEIGAAKACALVEGARLPSGEEAALAAIGLDRAAPGLAGAEVWDSIYTPGKAVALVGWTAPERALAFARGGGLPTRRRAVRIIREYGMFDRRETPQYHSPVASADAEPGTVSSRAGG